ncbi:IS5 family transposase [Ferruginivarius sediminum]|uniref:IS5 family transposase n=1 Tax=Ferruginivarius sediminum TaxID=2661937 RepID=A0A369T5C1_9PROT|nr:IS5 family transposase [Ferruginivarius sediminum]RDD60112.1 IS5 family transposase [Ferruginivarius sediminum]
MRGDDGRSGSLFSYVDLEARVPKHHPLRVIRGIVDDGLGELSGTFAEIYSDQGRPSIPPERLLRALLLQALYGLRSERQMMERLDFDLLFRWFVGLGIDDRVWHPTVYAKNRDRLFEGVVAERFLAAILAHPKVKPLLSREHFSVDGTLIEAWASVKSFQPKDQDDSTGDDDPPSGGRNAERDFHGERRSNATHASTTDPDARLFRKGRGKEARLAYMGHLLTENRNGLIVDVRTTRAHGNAETLAAVDMLAARPCRPGMTVGADKGYDTADFVMEVRDLGITPHVAQNAYDTGKARRRSAIDGRTIRHAGYAASQRARKRIEECFGWIKAGAGGRKARHRGLDRVGWQVTLTAAAYNLVRLPKLLAAAP